MDNKLEIGLLLRQQVPKDKERIIFDSLSNVDDVWIQLFYLLHKKLGLKHSEIWMWGGDPRTTKYKNNFVEKWYKEFPTKNINFDFIFSRGGFKQYTPVMQACSSAFRLYYGSIFKKRFNPEANGDTTKYNMILADSQTQYDELVKSGYNAFRFLKPACENIFKSINTKKEFDVLFIANATQKKFKGHEWFFRKMEGTGLKILWIGKTDTELISLCKSLDLDIKTTGWIPRKHIPPFACLTKVGVCCSEGDSCPRIIPEMLCMNIPIVVRRHSQLHLWNDYFDDPSSMLVDGDNFIEGLRKQIGRYKGLHPKKFYFNNFSLELVSNSLAREIKRFLPIC
uniref:Glycosyltransferase n=1 Tax=viral metagenome TaxID=1070528 RepID=A0A6M3IZH9_9ZZZZ